MELTSSRGSSNRKSMTCRAEVPVQQRSRSGQRIQNGRLQKPVGGARVADDHKLSGERRVAARRLDGRYGRDSADRDEQDHDGQCLFLDAHENSPVGW